VACVSSSTNETNSTNSLSESGWPSFALISSPGLTLTAGVLRRVVDCPLPPMPRYSRAKNATTNSTMVPALSFIFVPPMRARIGDGVAQVVRVDLQCGHSCPRVAISHRHLTATSALVHSTPVAMT